MTNYMECFDEILSAADAGASEEQMKNILNKDEIKACFQNNIFCGDFIALCIAKDYAAGINAARDAAGLDTEKEYPESISYFLPLLSGKRRRTAQLSCAELVENAFGLYAIVFGDDIKFGYNSMLYMFIVGDCTESIEKFLDIYALTGAADDSLSDFIRIAAKRKKTEIIKLFTSRGFTVSEEDIEYLYGRDAEYADTLIKNELIAVRSEPYEEEEEGGDVQIIKNWTIKTDVDRIEVSGNIYDSLHGLPDGRFYTFEASYCAALNDDEFIVCEKGVKNNNSYILRYDGELKNDSHITTAKLDDIFEFCKNNTADYEKMAKLLLSEGDSLVIPGIGYSSRTVQNGEQPKGKRCYVYHYNAQEKKMTRFFQNPKNEKCRVPGFRKCGREFYMCFDLLAEVFEDIMKDRPCCGYIGKIRKMLDADIGRTEKDNLTELIFTCLRYYASEENYSEAVGVLREYGLDYRPMPCYDSADRVFDLLNAESTEAKSAAYKRILFRPDLNVFSIIPYYAGNIIGSIDETFHLFYSHLNDASSIICWFAEKRDWNTVSKFANMFFRINDMDMLELALRSPDTVYDFIQNNFYHIAPDDLKRDGIIKSVDEMIKTLTYSDFAEVGYSTLISNAYIFFDKKDFEFILSRMPEIKYVGDGFLNEIYRNEIRYCRGAYDGKPEIAYYFDRHFAETVKISGNGFAFHPTIKNEMRSKLTNHRFIVTVHHLSDIMLGLPKNYVFALSEDVDTDEFLYELIKSENKHKIIAAIRHNILNEDNVRQFIEYAVENRYYSSLKAIYKVFNLIERK